MSRRLSEESIQSGVIDTQQVGRSVTRLAIWNNEN